MKHLLIVLFFSGCHQSPHTSSDSFDPRMIGTRSDTSKRLVLSKAGQKIVHLKAGPQPGVNASGQSNITYLSDRGTVIFTSQIKLGNTRNIKFDGPSGFKYTGNDYAVFNSGIGNNQGDTIRNFDFGNTAYTVFDALTKIFISPGVWLTYNGTPQSTVFWGLTVDSFKVSGKTSLFQGPWEKNNTFHMVSAGLTFMNGVFVNDGTGDNGKIRSNSLYGLKVDGWKVTGPTLSGGGDYGIILIVGTGTIKNVYRNGGWGYLERLVISKLAGIPFDQTCGIYQCVDLNSTHYGTVDVRMESSDMSSTSAMPLTGSDFYFINNISGDKKDDGTYVTNAIVLGSLKDDLNKKWTIYIKNNLAFNAMPSAMSNASSLLKNNSNGFAILDSANNSDWPPVKTLVAGWLDSIYHRAE